MKLVQFFVASQRVTFGQIGQTKDMSSYSVKLWLCIALCFAACHLPTFAVVVNSSEYSLITKEQMLALPAPERTAASALRLCLERSSENQFCAWLLVEPQTELVLGGTCFDEYRYPCNRYGYTRSTSTRLPIRHLTCDGCSSCSAQRSACNGVNCTMLCYCSCGHSYNAGRKQPAGQGFVFDPSRSNWHFVYPCSGLCDRKLHCPFGEDESKEVCEALKSLSMDMAPKSMSELVASPDFYTVLFGVLIVLGFATFFLLNLKYKWYPWLLRHPSSREAAAAALLQDQMRQQQQTQPPPALSS